MTQEIADELKLFFEKSKSFGSIDLSKYLRVTEVLKPFTGVEFVPEHILLPASVRGTKVHDCIEELLNGFPMTCEEDNIKPYVESFEAYWKDNEHAFKNGRMELEKRLYCHKHMITGKSDCLIIVGDRTYIIDWKTSNSMQKKSWSIQGAVYRYLAEQNKYPNVEDALFVKLDKKGKKPTLYKFNSYEKDLEMFFKCLEIYRHFDMHITRRFNEY